jgi:hypothetical protein
MPVGSRSRRQQKDVEYMFKTSRTTRWLPYAVTGAIAVAWFLRYVYAEPEMAHARSLGQDTRKGDLVTAVAVGW